VADQTTPTGPLTALDPEPLAALRDEQQAAYDALCTRGLTHELDEAIINYMKRAYNLMIGERTAEEIKLRIGSAYPLGKETTMEVKGRDMVAGLPKTITITSQEVREAMLEPLNTIIDAVRTTLERCPPELSADLVDRGIMLAGGGALLRGLDKLLQEETALPVHVAEDPLSAVAEGAGRVLSEIEFLRKVSTNEA
jgi:rod shape-determining protein MreB